MQNTSPRNSGNDANGRGWGDHLVCVIITHCVRKSICDSPPNGKVKPQLSGTAIGTKFAPPCAYIFMDKVETSFLEIQKMKPLVWFRYIDVFYLGKRNLIHFLKNLIDITLNLNLHMSQVKRVCHFLILKWAASNPQTPDLTLHIVSSWSYYTLHCYSQALRISRICSDKSVFLKHLESTKSWFEVRGYPNNLLEQEMEKVNFFKNGNVARQGNPRKGFLFVLTYHPLFKSVGKTINFAVYG